MGELLERLRARGWRMTAQRRVIAEVFRGDHVHLTADEVFATAKQTLPEVSMATVYNALGELVAMGELKEVVHHDGRKRYDPNTEVDHHHLICDRCGAMRDIELEAPPILPRHQRGGYLLFGVDVTFHGRCPDCTG